jgi:signal transduction histidine kinase
MQVFTNLMMNSIHAVARRGKVRVTTGVARQNGMRWLRVTLSDNGKGIPATQLESIFEPFYTTKSHGTGLGLTIVKKIVEQHQGKILVDSRPGQYTKFSILLPLA